MMGLTRILAAVGAHLIRSLSRLPIGCGAWLLARAQALEDRARRPPP